MLEPARLRPERIRPLTRDEFEQLVSLGAFQGERVELLRGALVTMSAQEEPHARISAWFTTQLARALDPERFEVRAHTSYAATWDSVPEPDVQVIEKAPRRRLPRRALLLIEVTGSSMYRDREIKAPIYGENRAPEYWIVDIPNEVVWVHTRPSRTGYRSIVKCGPGEVLHPVKLPRMSIEVDDIPWAPRPYRRRGSGARRRRPR